jgi:hypothetical protein
LDLLGQINTSTGFGSTPTKVIGGVSDPYNILTSPQVQGQTDTSTPAATPDNSAAIAAAKQSALNNAWWQSMIGQVDDQIGRLGHQADIGHQNISDSFNSAFNTLTNQKTSAQNQYNTTVDRTKQDNLTAKDGIDSSVRNGLTGLQRLLGMYGAGNSSATEIMAPYAAGYEGNQQRAQVNNAFGRNMQDLDTNWNNTNQQFDDSFGALNTDRTNRDRELDAKLDGTRASLLGQKGTYQQNMGMAPDAGIRTQIDALGHQVDDLGRTQTFTPKLVNYQAPNLQSYNYDPSQGPQVNQDTSADQNMGVYSNIQPDKKTKTPIAALLGA